MSISTAHHSNPSQNLTALHKDQHSDNKTSNGEPSAFKNITLRKTATSLKKPQIPRSNAPVVRNALASSANTTALKTGASTPAHVKEPETQVQATGRAILVQSLHDGVKHVVQGFILSHTKIFSYCKYLTRKLLFTFSSVERKTPIVCNE